MGKWILLSLFFFYTGTSWSFSTGYNQAWLKNAYAHQWEDHYYDKSYVDNLLKFTMDSKARILRMWLYEGSWLSQFEPEKKSGKLRIRPDIIKNLRHFLKSARKFGIKINLTFLDGNSFQYVVDRPELSNFWWNIFNNKYDKQKEFYDFAIRPIYQLVEKDFRDVVVQFDIANEVNAIAQYHLFEDPKLAMSSFLCKMKEGSPAPVTASLGWANAEELFFGGFLDQACLDFYDIHFYNDQGSIPQCEKYKLLAQKNIILQLGEFGQSSPDLIDDLQSFVTSKFIQNAKECGFQSAMAWRLLDHRDAPNPEARFSYILDDGRPRPAYWTFKDLSL